MIYIYIYILHSNYTKDVDAYIKLISHALKDKYPEHILILYNIPQRSNGQGIERHTVELLVQNGIVAGIKDSAGKKEILDGYLELKSQDFRVFVGAETMLEYALSNKAPKRANGGVNAALNVIPGVLEEMYTLLIADRVEDAKPYVEFLNRFQIEVYDNRTDLPGGIANADYLLGVLDRGKYYPASKFGSKISLQRFETIKTYLNDVVVAEKKYNKALLPYGTLRDFDKRTYEGLVELWK